MGVTFRFGYECSQPKTTYGWHIAVMCTQSDIILSARSIELPSAGLKFLTHRQIEFQNIMVQMVIQKPLGLMLYLEAQ